MSFTDDIARLLIGHEDITYEREAWPDGPWAGHGWVCRCQTLVLPPSTGSVPAGISPVRWWHAKHVARLIVEAVS